MSEVAVGLFALVALAAIAALLVALRRPVWLFALHVLSRALLDSFSRVTYEPLVGPFSIMQCYSISFVVLFTIYLLFHRAKLVNAFTVPVLLVAFAYGVSGLLYTSALASAEFILRWLYLLLLIAMAQLATEANGQRSVFLVCLLVSLYPIANQLSMIPFIPPSCGGTGEICSHKGTFYHEGGFSSWALLLTASALFLTLDARSIKARLFYGALVPLGAVSLLLASYRTAMLAGVVMVAATAVVAFPRFSTGVRLLLFSIGLISAIGVLFTPVPLYLESRFGDIDTFISDPGHYIDFDNANVSRELFSGRLYLFSAVMTEYFKAPLEAQIIGLGPDSIQELLGTYSHNEFVSALAESGIVGFVGLVVFVAMALVFSARRALRGELGSIVAFAVVLTILTLGLATMPFQQPPSLILLAVALGVVAASQGHASRPTPVPEARAWPQALQEMHERETAWR